MTSARNRAANEALRQQTLDIFARLKYQILDAASEQGGDYTPTGREHDGEVVLRSRLRAALPGLNQHIAPEVRDQAINAAIDALTDSRALLTPAEANRQVYKLLKDGIQVKITPPAGSVSSEEYPETVKVVHWTEAGANDFLLVANFWVNGHEGRGRQDFVGFVNGLPLLLPIARAAGMRENPLQHLYETEINDYKRRFPQLFWYNALILLSDGQRSKLGSLTSPWEHFTEWKRIEREDEAGNTSLETLLVGICAKARLLDIVENFTLFGEKAGGLEKIIARNHQYLGVNAAFARMQRFKELEGKLGVFWHTQGAGKSYSMIFFEQKVQRKLPGNWRFVVITDRIDLDQQIYQNFARTGAVTEPEEVARITSIEDLEPRLRENHSILFILIQKFENKQPGQVYKEIANSDEIIVMTDEAHRSQYAELARNLNKALPRASYLGFTGTPLIGEEIHRTRDIFGPYISKYPFFQAIEDGVTVPLIYENRTPELRLQVAEVARQLLELEKRAGLSDEEKQKLRRELFQEKELIKSGARLDFVAHDIVEHFMNRGYMGKAMVVCIDKLTTVRTYNRVRQAWLRYREQLEQLLAQEQDPEQRANLAEKLTYMRTTDMAVVVSTAEQDENDAFALFNKNNPQEQVDIQPHYDRFNREKLDEKFKEPEDPLRIVFVCFMWMTGFDVPCLSTLYLDHPMQMHTLMQAIARPNRIYGPEKTYGQVVDYVGIYGDLVDALKIYARPELELSASALEMPFSEKHELIHQLEKALIELEEFCRQQGVDVPHKLALLAAAHSKMERDAQIQQVANDLLVREDVKLNYLSRAWFVYHLYRALLPDKEASRFAPRIHFFRQVQQVIFAAMNCVNIDEVLAQARRVVAEETTVSEYEPRWLRHDPDAIPGKFDLSKVNIDVLAGSIQAGNAYLQAERLRSLLNQKLQQMIHVNPKRVSYLDRLQELTDKYNESSANYAGYPAEITEFARELREEELRPSREALSEEELAIADLLVPDQPFSDTDWQRVKEIARLLLATLKSSNKLVDNWYNKPEMNSGIKIIIRETLEKLPASYSKALYDQKCEETYRYVRIYYENYGGDNGPLSA